MTQRMKMINTVSNEYSNQTTPDRSARLGAADSPFEEWVDVSIHLEPALGIIQLSDPELPAADATALLLYSEDFDAVRAACADAGGRGLWCAKYSKLLIPSSHAGAGNRFFTLCQYEPERVGEPD
ncbi:hypothetical protein LVY72_03330 [Arthrobacter sp. I2-34]|uniref:Uncharacterized protein n=1 Tax=Arthrobacter hankyongi TaxID=2904801 RepID=A0ABS9L2P0_9MICC|nr:hypothetical protein [Arthrobacter hankyongi]MCG2620944.1 hypothetical protein [Arthrobacter hankyongi]